MRVKERHPIPAGILGLDLLEKLTHGPGVIAGVVEDLRAHRVGLRFIGSRVLHQDGIHGEACAQLRDRGSSGVAAQQAAKNRKRQLCGGGLAGLVGTVAQGYVRGFVRHHARQLGFIVSGFNHAAVDVNVPAGKRKSIDRAVVHGPVRIGKFVAGRIYRKPLSQAVQVVVNPGVVQHAHLALDLARRLLANFNILLRREHVPARRQSGAAILVAGANVGLRHNIGISVVR